MEDVYGPDNQPRAPDDEPRAPDNQQQAETTADVGAADTMMADDGRDPGNQPKAKAAAAELKESRPAESPTSPAESSPSEASTK